MAILASNMFSVTFSRESGERDAERVAVTFSFTKNDQQNAEKQSKTPKK